MWTEVYKNMKKVGQRRYDHSKYVELEKVKSESRLRLPRTTPKGYLRQKDAEPKDLVSIHEICTTKKKNLRGVQIKNKGGPNYLPTVGEGHFWLRLKK